MSEVNHNKGLDYVGISAAHFEETTKFYQEGLGFTIAHQWEWGENGKAYIMDMGNGDCIEIGNDGDPNRPGVGKFTHMALATDDINAAFDRAVKAGGKIKVKPTFSCIDHAVPKPLKMWFAYVIGFENEEIEFIQMVED